MSEAAGGDIWAVVPLKTLSDAKQRLASILDAPARRGLMLAMIRDVLAALQGVPAVNGILLVSRDPMAEVLATEFDLECFANPADEDLNSALGAALADLQRRGVATAIVLPGDLPLIRSIDINAMLAKCKRENELLIVADLDQDGTNCLIASPPNAITLQFGSNSFSCHGEAAKAAALTLITPSPENVWLDIDEPADFEALKRAVLAGEAAPETSKFVCQI
jgi:2-phospho-L-lactate guanylyltransferase